MKIWLSIWVVLSLLLILAGVALSIELANCREGIQALESVADKVIAANDAFSVGDNLIARQIVEEAAWEAVEAKEEAERCRYRR